MFLDWLLCLTLISCPFVILVTRIHLFLVDLDQGSGASGIVGHSPIKLTQQDFSRSRSYRQLSPAALLLCSAHFCE
ncbi:hypothetical protein SynBIOSU31_02672 [Synechococcus sp. BIOS-U3-1]|nr:hypothetical protein SynBIOSU31_02672 [Synechococcus sp. BIOS-U3-1]